MREHERLMQSMTQCEQLSAVATCLSNKTKCWSFIKERSFIVVEKLLGLFIYILTNSKPFKENDLLNKRNMHFGFQVTLK